MSETSDRPAFPQPSYMDSGGTVVKMTGGMTLREYAAIHALQGILASRMINESTAWTPESISKWAVEVADATLARLAKEGGR